MEHSVIQKEFIEKVRQGVRFVISGHSLRHGSTTYPVAMAKAVGLKPKVDDYIALEKVWKSSY